MLPEVAVRSLEASTGLACRAVSPVSGSGLSRAARVTLQDGTRLFVKWQEGETAPLRAEKKGLDELRAAESGLIIPACIAFDFALEGGGMLAVEWLEHVPPDTDHWVKLGSLLARLHGSVNDQYGFADDNFIGLLPQRNDWSDSWPQFFADSRLHPQVEVARQRSRWREEWSRPFERLCIRLAEILPTDPGASLVHGDLWAGNAMPTALGPAVYDPAVYYGHREVDLAMTVLFGGFSKELYEAYDNAWPRDRGFGQRTEVYNLYHLLNHLNIFGDSYAGGISRILTRFG